MDIKAEEASPELEAASANSICNGLCRRQTPRLALHSKVADLRIEDSQNLANANYSDPWLLWQSAVKDAQRRNGINGGDPRSGEEAVYASFAYP